MKRHAPWRALILCSALLLPVASPQAGEFLLGASAGYGSKRGGVTAINDDFSQQFIQARADSGDENRRAWQLFLDVPLSERLMVRGGYADLGAAHPAVLGSDPRITTYVENLSPLPLDHLKGGFLSALYRIPLNDMVELAPHAGLFYWRADHTVTSQLGQWAENREGVDPTLGLGLHLRLGNRLELILQWQLFKAREERVDALGLGLGWRAR